MAFDAATCRATDRLRKFCTTWNSITLSQWYAVCAECGWCCELIFQTTWRRHRRQRRQPPRDRIVVDDDDDDCWWYAECANTLSEVCIPSIEWQKYFRDPYWIFCLKCWNALEHIVHLSFDLISMVSTSCVSKIPRTLFNTYHINDFTSARAATRAEPAK